MLILIITVVVSKLVYNLGPDDLLMCLKKLFNDKIITRLKNITLRKPEEPKESNVTLKEPSVSLSTSTGSCKYDTPTIELSKLEEKNGKAITTHVHDFYFKTNDQINYYCCFARDNEFLNYSYVSRESLLFYYSRGECYVKLRNQGSVKSLKTKKDFISITDESGEVKDEYRLDIEEKIILGELIFAVKSPKILNLEFVEDNQSSESDNDRAQSVGFSRDN